MAQVLTKKPDRLESTINKYKVKGLNIVADYLLTKGRKSKRTAVTFSYGLDYLNKFIEQKYNGKYNIQSILSLLKSEKASRLVRLDVYSLLNNFVSYLQNNTTNGAQLSAATYNSYMNAARSYLQYNDIEISPSKFKYKVSLPPVYHEDEEPIDSNDIKEILNHCNNRRLKAYLLVLASGGMRAIEALGIRECDSDFGTSLQVENKDSPAGIRIRKEYAKTRTERHIFISNEAARYLHDWIEFKYRDRHLENKRLVNRIRSKDDLVFSRLTYTSKYPMGLYTKMLVEFQKVLEVAGLASRKSDGVYKRRKITFHSFRRFVKTTIANQTRNTDYSEWFLGHKKSSYYVNKPDELRRIYKEDCMKYLTFLDYPTVEAVGTSYEAKLKEKDREIQGLKDQIAKISLDVSSDTQKLKHQVEEYLTEMDNLKGLLAKVVNRYQERDKER
jgi:integrase